MKNSTKFTVSMLLAASVLTAAGGASAFLGMFEEDKNPLHSERRSPALNNSSYAPLAAPVIPELPDPYAYGAPQEFAMNTQPMGVPLPPENIPYSAPYSAPYAGGMQSPLVQPQSSYVGEDGFPKLSSIPPAPVVQVQPTTADPRVAELQNDYNQSQQMMGSNEYLQIPPPPQYSAQIPEIAPMNPGMQRTYSAPQSASAPMMQQNPMMPNYAAAVTNEYSAPMQYAAAQPEPVFPSGPSVTVRSKRAGAMPSSAQNAPAYAPPPPAFTPEMANANPVQPAYTPIPMAAEQNYAPAQNYEFASNQPAPVFPSGPSVTVRSKRAGGGVTTNAPAAYNPAPVMPEVVAYNADSNSAPAPMVSATPLMGSGSIDSFEVASAPAPMGSRVVSESYAPVASSYDNPLLTGSHTVGSVAPNFGGGYRNISAKKFARVLPESRYAKYRRIGEK